MTPCMWLVWHVLGSVAGVAVTHTGTRCAPHAFYRRCRVTTMRCAVRCAVRGAVRCADVSPPTQPRRHYDAVLHESGATCDRYEHRATIMP
jgi:hypothetical protein